MNSKRSRTQATVALAAMAAISLTACGTTVRHHGAAGQISAGTGSDTSLGVTGTSEGGVPSGGGGAGSAGGGSSAPAGSGAVATTAPVSAGSPAGSGTGTGTGNAPAGNSRAGSGATATRTAAPQTGSSKTQPSTRGGATPKPTAAATRTGEAALPTGQATLSPVEIGFAYFTDLGDATVQTGGKAAQSGDEKVEAQSAIDYVNSHGGLYGHPITPDWYPFQLLSTTPYATDEQSVCSNWTQDHHAALGMFVGAAVPNDLASCLSAKGVAFMTDGAYLHDETTFSQITGLLSPSEVTTTEAMKALVANAISSGWVKPTDKVGVLVGENEDAAVRAYTNVVAPGLKGHALSVASYPVDYPSSTADATNVANQIQSDQVQMRADGVTKVIMMAPGALSYFTKDADQQKYDPQYALTTWDTPTGVQGGAIPASQLVNVLGLGWQPVLDVGTYGKTDYDNTTTKLCRTIETPNGQDTGQLPEYAQQVICTAILEVQAMAMKARPTTITGGALVAGYNALGGSFPDSLTLSSNFAPGAGHAGAASYRMFTYNKACDCNQYTSPAAAFS